MCCGVKKIYNSVSNGRDVVCNKDFAFFKNESVGLSNVLANKFILNLESIDKDIILLIIISFILPLLAK
jgi:hypothetical protein